MRQKFVLKAGGIGIAMALFALAPPSIAQQPYNADDTSQLRPEADLEQPSDMPQPRGYVEEPGAEIRTPSGLGAQGPIRSDDPSLYQDQSARVPSASSTYPQNTAQADYEMARQRGERGYMGFLQWQQHGSNSP